MKIEQNNPITLPSGQLNPVGTLTGDTCGADLEVAKAKLLVAQEDFDAAEQLLASIPQTPESLDLLARLYGQQGDWSSARTAWETLLRIDPHNSAASDALRRLSSNWLLKAIAARVLRLVATAALIAFSAAGVLFIFNVLPELTLSPSPLPLTARRPTPMPEHPPLSPQAHGDVEGQVAEKPPEEPASTLDTGASEVTPSLTEPYKEPVPTAPPIPRLSLDGAVVSINDGQVVIVFNEGIFRYRCELSEAAEHSLQNVVAALSDCPPVRTLLIAGHTDNDPMPPGGPFPSNYALGFARAATVASWFRDNSAIPHDVFVTTSHGAEAPPFSNDDYDSRLRNRTVVLRVQFQQPPMDRQP